jgi:hypothetical protein
MSGIFGALGLNTTDDQSVYVATVGQRAVYDAVNETLAQHNQDVALALSVFVDETTSDHKRRYMLPGGGRLQRMGGQGQAGGVKATGSWDVAFPLEEFGAQIVADRVAFAYMTMADLDRHLKTVQAQDLNTVRFELLKRLLNNVQSTFVDPRWGSLSIEPLANNDAVVYPPVLGSESESADDHYLESNYAASAISDTNNPYVTIRDELEEHFGADQGGSNIVVFINNAQVAKTEALADFDPVNDRYTAPGADTDTLFGLPANLPGRIIGRTNGVWVVEWRWIPANYMVGIHMGAPKPLIMRVDPASTGLGQGLQLVAESDTHPFSASHYSHRFGLGAGNRLNGVVMELGTGGTYSIPSGYS